MTTRLTAAGSTIVDQDFLDDIGAQPQGSKIFIPGGTSAATIKATIEAASNCLVEFDSTNFSSFNQNVSVPSDVSMSGNGATIGLSGSSSGFTFSSRAQATFVRDFDIDANSAALAPWYVGVVPTWNGASWDAAAGSKTIFSNILVRSVGTGGIGMTLSNLQNSSLYDIRLVNNDNAATGLLVTNGCKNIDLFSLWSSSCAGPAVKITTDVGDQQDSKINVIGGLFENPTVTTMTLAKSSTTVTLGLASHGKTVGQTIRVPSSNPTPTTALPTGNYTIATVATNSFTVETTAGGSIGGGTAGVYFRGMIEVGDAESVRIINAAVNAQNAPAGILLVASGNRDTNNDGTGNGARMPTSVFMDGVQIQAATGIHVHGVNTLATAGGMDISSSNADLKISHGSSKFTWHRPNTSGVPTYDFANPTTGTPSEEASIKTIPTVVYTADNAPAAGTHAVRQCAVSDTGRFYICTVAGTPGTWVEVT